MSASLFLLLRRCNDEAIFLDLKLFASLEPAKLLFCINRVRYAIANWKGQKPDCTRDNVHILESWDRNADVVQTDLATVSDYMNAIYILRRNCVRGDL